MDLSGLFTKLFIFIVLMVAGYVCARSKYVGKEFTRDASKLVINLFMTFTIINSVIGIQSDVNVRELGYAMLVLSASIVVCYIIAFIISRLFHIDSEHDSLFEMLLAAPNIMFISLPVLDQLFGSTAVFYCSLTGLPYNILLYSYGISRLKGKDESHVNALKNIMSMPLIATLIAGLLYFTKLPIPGFIKELIASISSATMPLSMIVIGASLGSVSLADAFKNKQLYAMSFLRLIFAPLLVWLIFRMFTNDIVLLSTAVIMAASPSGLTISVLAIQFKRDVVYASEGVLLSTVLSMLTIPTLILILGI